MTVHGDALVFEAIGTVWNIEWYSPLDITTRTELETAIIRRIEDFDCIYSRFRTDSLVTRIARSAGTYIFPSDADALFSMYRTLYELSQGAVTPLIGGLMEDSGYDADYSLIEKPLRPVPQWDEVMQFEGGTLTTTRPVMLDFGAAGKGYLVDIVTSLIVGAGVESFSVNAGGDIFYKTSFMEGLQVALEHPLHDDEAVGIATIYNQSICGSAGNRRSWGQFHHVIDPLSLASPTHIAALWTVAHNALTADALTTALYFVSPERLATQFSFEYAILHADLSLNYSSAFPAEFFVSSQNLE